VCKNRLKMKEKVLNDCRTASGLCDVHMVVQYLY
jgi:hypothetical protein